MKKRILFLTATTLMAIALSGCGQKDVVEKVSFATLEDARAQARANAEYNATIYRSENPRLQGMKVVGHGDSTQVPECPQGDGWASLSMMNVDKERQTVEKYKIKCSTVSSSLGCYTEDDFVKKPFAKDEGQCQDMNKVPFPLPKLAK